MDFSSDTCAPAHPAMIEAVTAANSGQAASYGSDEHSKRVERALAERFECEVAIFPISSGTASNALCVSLFCSPTGATLCHQDAHVVLDERGACEFYSGGGKLQLLPGHAGKIELAALQAAVDAHDPDFFHATPVEALTLTNLTECGTLYSPAEIAERADLAKSIGLGVHLDGARLGNALASSDASLADLTWRSGVDAVSLGFTKLGAMGSDVIVLLRANTSRFEELRVRAKRAGHVPAKLRYVSAQADAMLEDDLWLKLAGQANQRARELATAFAAAGISLAYPADGNEVFPNLDERQIDALHAAGAKFYPWPGGAQRFVCSWTTSQEEVAQFAAALRAL